MWLRIRRKQMLSPSQLERVGSAYYDGYYDGYYGKPRRTIDNRLSGAFAGFDYQKGYEAGVNDAKWSAYYRKHDAR
jgi:hypothetical protein